MTSRPPLGVQQRQPQQRKLSGPALSQQRSLSQSQVQVQAQLQQQQQQQQLQQQQLQLQHQQQQQQQQHHQQLHQHQQQQLQHQPQQYDASSYLPPPPPPSSMRNNTNLNNFNQNNALNNAFPSDFVQQDPATSLNNIVSPADPSGSSPALSVGGVGRYGTQRRGGSRLRLELSHNDPSDTFSSPTVIESPGLMEPHNQYGSLTHLMMPLTDGSNLGEMSPHDHHQLSVPPQHLDADVPIPFPQRRPKAVPDHPRREQPPPPPNQARKDTRPKPYTIELPAAAPRYRIRGRNDGQGGQGRSSALATGSSSTTGGSATANYGCADFFPWSGTAGNHPEDQFNENVIKSGWAEKAIVNPETQSAKTVLFHGLKQRSGLNALSIFFAGVLWHRRNAGQVTAPSTFKPPPRVTLTDTKKEVWLKDLANSAIPLRKLSRSIPHGVRNKVLLDQCLNKNVPIDRAVWLAKCVGTNELRTFRRLGKGNNASVVEGERKWLKDWTSVIEQFVERVIFSFGEQNWKAKVSYAIQLATHLYAEGLMDREHYLDWTVSSLESSHHSQLPMWIIIAQIYWKDLLRLRKYGRRLATALISHYHVIHSHEDRDIYAPLLSKLSHLLGSLMVATPENFVSPAVWVKYRDALKTCLPQGDEARHRSFAGINYRNEQLVASANRSQPAARIILVRNLDQVILEKPMPDEFPAQCWTVSKDKGALARALLEWCTTPYRPGLAKVYVAHRILMHWSTLGMDVTLAVLDFLDGEVLEEKERKDALYHLVSELVRSGVFMVSRYIQRLIARGGLTDPNLVEPNGPPFARLLAELPPHILGSSQRRSRDALLRRAGFPVEAEARDADAAVLHLRNALGLPMGVTDAASIEKRFSPKKIARLIEVAGRARKAEIASWLRNTVTGGEIEHSSLNAFDQHEVSTKLFNSIRRILEATQEFSVFAEVLKFLTQSSNSEVLASIADTITRHTFVFAALGCLKNLFGILRGRLSDVVRDQGIGARPLLASLAYLASRVPGMDEAATQLKSDLALSDRHNPVDACSPVSDNMVSRLQDNDGDLHEEVEKLLANGTSLDRNTMDRLFSAVIQRLQTYWTKGDEQQRVYGILLKRLRMFDPQHFDELMGRWLLYVRGLNRRATTILHLYPLLVSTGCLGLPAILSTASEVPNASGPGNQRNPQAAVATAQIVQTTFRTRYMQEVLQLFMVPVSTTSLLTPEERYRFGILQEQAKKESPRELLCLIQLALAEYTYARAQNDAEDLPLDKEGNQTRLLELLRLLVLKDPVGVAKALQVRGPDARVASWIDGMTTKLLVTAAGEGTRVTFEQVLNLTNEFTLPFCHVKLLLSLSSNDQQQNAADSGERVPSNVELFMNAMEKSMDAQRVSWIGMLPSLSPDLTHHLKNQAQTRFLNLLPSSRNPPSMTLDRSTLQMRLQKAENFLAIMDTIIRGSGPMGFRQHQLVPVMVERFTDILELLQTLTPLSSQAGGLGGWGGQGVSAAAASGDNHADLKSDILNHWLPLFLNFLTLHAQTFDTSKPGNEVRGRALIVCAGLIRELDLIHGPDFDTRQLGGRIFDLACVLVDNLAEDARLQCIQALKSPSDVKLRYIFSYQDNPHANLMLSHKERPTPMSMGANTGTGSPAPGTTPTHTPGVTPGPQVTGPQSAGGASGAGGSGNNGGYFNLPGHTQQAQAQGWHAAQQQQQMQQQQQQQYHQLQQQQQQQQQQPQQGGTGPMPSPAISINTNLSHLNVGNNSNPPTPSPMNPMRPTMVMVVNPWGGYSWVPTTMGGSQERLTPFNFRQWEMLSEPTSQVGENDTAVNLTLFESRKVQ